jgi:hypothetical protein
MRPKRYRHERRMLSLVCERPVRLRARLFDGKLRLHARLWPTGMYMDSGMYMNSISAGITLTKSQTQDFFCRLAELRGYALPGKKRAKPIPGVLIVETDKGLELDLFVSRHKRRRHESTTWLATARVIVPIQKRAVQKLCEELAGPLGWELLEGWEYR